ncbi:MAG TPA: DUF4397 domain-containing protein [Mucilaginibacter sp.]
MKKKYLFLTVMLLSTLIYSCKKNTIRIIDQKVDGSTAQIKYFNFGVNAPSINFYANGVKVSATSSATGVESKSGTVYGGVFPSLNYSLIAGGTYTFKGQIPSTATTDADLAILSLSGTVENGKYYSFYACGLYNTTAKTSDAFMVEDKLPAIDTTVAYVRFVNTIPNAPSDLGLYAKNTTTLTETTVATSIAYKTASDFVSVPVGFYELYARYPAAPTVNVISRNSTTNGAVSFVGGKVYTIGARGDITVVSSTAANRPLLDNTPNR